MRKWTVVSPTSERKSLITEPSDAERIKLRAQAFSRWIANLGRRAEEERRTNPNGADR